ncbi:hypothetical protein BC937DRAFT_93176, partial [Endogone sp. FLAS-F59071]
MASATPTMDMALDDIISEKKSQRRRGASTGNNSRRGNNAQKRNNNNSGPIRHSPRSNAGVRSSPYGGGGATQPRVAVNQGGGGEGSKILVSNLDYNVTEADLRELFETGVGPLRKVQLNYDQSGKSKGQATIIFQRARDGAVAFDKFHNVTLDRGRSGSRGRGGRGRSGKKEARPQKTQEELDAEMAEYMNVDFDILLYILLRGRYHNYYY